MRLMILIQNAGRKQHLHRIIPREYLNNSDEELSSHFYADEKTNESMKGCICSADAINTNEANSSAMLCC